MKLLLTCLLFCSGIASYAQSNTFSTDDYPIPGYMLKGQREWIAKGRIISVEHLWLTNDSLKETIAIQLGPDHFRHRIFHVRCNDVPLALIQKLELYKEDSAELVPISMAEKQENLQYFLYTGRPVDASLFKSKKGFNLGSERNRAIDIYGAPDSLLHEGDVEICKWDFRGTKSFEISKYPKHKMMAMNSFGYHVTMFFREEKLIAVILENEMP